MWLISPSTPATGRSSDPITIWLKKRLLVFIHTPRLSRSLSGLIKNPNTAWKDGNLEPVVSKVFHLSPKRLHSGRRANTRLTYRRRPISVQSYSNMFWWGVINKQHDERVPSWERLHQNNYTAAIKWHVNRKPSALPHNDRLYGEFNKPLSVYCPHALSLPIEKYPFGLWHPPNYEPWLFTSPSPLPHILQRHCTTRMTYRTPCFLYLRLLLPYALRADISISQAAT